MEDYRLEQTGAEVQEILNTSTPQADLTAETERAQEAESALGGRIDDEELRAKAAEEANAGAIHDEELRAKAAEEINANAIASINEKIPSAASSENKLADVDFVNSSIATATATYRGSFNLVSDLHLAIDATHAQIETLLGTVISVADKNDYCYVQIPTSAETPTQIASVELYKFTDEGWKFGYVLNNSGFTAAQWAALNSAITSGLVAKLNALPTNEELAALLGAKQDVLTFDNVPVEGSNNPVKSGGVHSAIDDEKTARVNNVNTLQGEIDSIEGKIPTGASSDNKLVDTATMNSSISTATATYRGDFNLVSDLHLAVDATHAQIATMLASEIATADNNDYCYVQIPTSAETPTQIAKVERYKYNGSAWGYEYDLNNSGFTASQWAALNSAITSGLVAKLSALPTNQELTAALAAKQDVLTFDNTPTENSTNPVTSGGVYAADKALSDAIEAILLLIPSAATQLNKLVDVAQMNSSISTATATYRGSYNLVSDLSLTIDATEQQIATALAATISTADNNDYAFVQVPTSSETPTQIARTDRYKYNGTVWAFEYTLNTSGFTAAQWAAINSGITTVLVAKLSALPTNEELTSALGLLNDGISAINLKIPATASQSNKLIDAAGLNETLALALGAIDATFNVQSTDGHITLHITQVDGEITSVQVQSSDIASAADLALKASQADLTALTTRVTTAESNITGLTTRMGTAETSIANLQQLYNDLQQSKPVPVTSLPSSGQQQGVIYRLAGATSYSDYMWNGSSWVLMATYNNATDASPMIGSDNIVKSGGVARNLSGIADRLSSLFDINGAIQLEPQLYQQGYFVNNSGEISAATGVYDLYKIVIEKGCPAYHILSKVFGGDHSPICVIFDANNNPLGSYGDMYLPSMPSVFDYITPVDVYLPLLENASYILINTFSPQIVAHPFLFAEKVGSLRKNESFVKQGYYASLAENYRFVESSSYKATPILDVSDLSSISLIETNINNQYVTNLICYDKNFNVIEAHCNTKETGVIRIINGGIKYISACCLVSETNAALIYRKKTKWADKNIAILGDSITEQGYVTDVLAAMDRCTILNYGVGGTTITLDGNPSTPNQDFCRRFEGAFTTDYNNGMQVDCFLMWGGVNDFAAKCDIGNISQANNQTTFYASLHRLAQDQKALMHDTPIVWITPLHTNYNSEVHKDWKIDNGVFSYIDNDNEYLYSFVDAIKEVASIYGIYVLDLYSIGPCPQVQPELFLDGIHPNAYGGAILGKQIHDFINSIC